ncbi:MAG: hypothetical protein ACK5TH_05105 [Prosthecobacter sp.]
MKTTLFLVLLSLTTLQARTWTSITGQTAEAELVKVDGENVVVRMADGRTSSFPISRLSEADQDYVKQQGGKVVAPPPAPAPMPVATNSAAANEAEGGLTGTWEGYMADSDGSKHGEIRLVITADKITASNPQGNREMGAGTYKLSGGRIDATGTEGQFAGKKYEGIFELDGKTLKWCSANDNPRSQRPSKMQTNPQAGQFLMVLEKK